MIYSFEILIVDKLRRDIDALGDLISQRAIFSDVVLSEKEGEFYLSYAREGCSYNDEAFNAIEEIDTIDGLACLLVNNLDEC
ncbi:hypothetical protein A3K86_14535 [Photobacterium jeanii]|uniref:Uncharacterized protein n=1 Tax=Photobacterium jeanii TaxID=858640 RepID=A0A178K9Y8_9GAMM|nr:hypothetical protein [Photobacterium jeanii]OAN13775.1 hypothetical protein A3K86_14535 [Photobacterium jeanii]PST92765.1 hypothetical protein C9I91_06265 [Photobacterium jeanii]